MVWMVQNFSIQQVHSFDIEIAKVMWRFLFFSAADEMLLEATGNFLAALYSLQLASCLFFTSSADTFFRFRS